MCDIFLFNISYYGTKLPIIIICTYIYLLVVLILNDRRGKIKSIYSKTSIPTLKLGIELCSFCCIYSKLSGIKWNTK